MYVSLLFSYSFSVSLMSQFHLSFRRLTPRQLWVRLVEISSVFHEPGSTRDMGSEPECEDRSPRVYSRTSTEPVRYGRRPLHHLRTLNTVIRH